MKQRPVVRISSSNPARRDLLVDAHDVIQKVLLNIERVPNSAGSPPAAF